MASSCFARKGCAGRAPDRALRGHLSPCNLGRTASPIRTNLVFGSDNGMTMIVVTHEMGFARQVARRVVFMDQGEIVEDAPTPDFFGRPRSERAQMFLSKILTH